MNILHVGVVFSVVRLDVVEEVILTTSMWGSDKGDLLSAGVE